MVWELEGPLPMRYSSLSDSMLTISRKKVIGGSPPSGFIIPHCLQKNKVSPRKRFPRAVWGTGREGPPLSRAGPQFFVPFFQGVWRTVMAQREPSCFAAVSSRLVPSSSSNVKRRHGPK